MSAVVDELWQIALLIVRISNSLSSHTQSSISRTPMSQSPNPQRLTVMLSAIMLIAGAALAIWSITHLPFGSRSNTAASAPQVLESAQETPTQSSDAAAGALEISASATVTPEVTQNVTSAADAPMPLLVLADETTPAALRDSFAALQLDDGSAVTVTEDAGQAAMRFDWHAGDDGQAVYAETFAAATRFDTIFPAISWRDSLAAWQSGIPTYTVVAVLSSTIPALEQVLGPAGAQVMGYATMDEVVDAAWAEKPTLAFVPFDRLVPRLSVLAIDGQNPVGNAHSYDAARYPLIATLYAHPTLHSTDEQKRVTQLLQSLPEGNRDPNRLTVLAMTGVTAMVRLMAREMDERGAAWPAEYVGEELSAADITHISNEVPFVEGCKTNTSMENFNFCTKIEYMETLRLCGVDIIGLTGNHQNDFGREAAVKSLDFYEKEGLPVYGGGRNKEAAFAPFYLTHNGNRLAFLGANSYGPQFAFATDTQPGSAEFNLAIMSATIRAIKEKNLADVVLPELQYQETYNTTPLDDQRDNFTALVRAGADIVTGVQSHVPQAMEFTNGKLVLYGLGNIFFDQMFSQATREGMIVEHTVYKGRHISTRILTTLIYDYGQPQWMNEEERTALLTRVFRASYWQ